VDDFLRESFKAKKYDKLKSEFKKYIEGYDAADPAKASIIAIREEMKAEDEVQYRPKTGYMPLIDYLQESCIKNGGVIKIAEPVFKISAGNTVEIITNLKKYTASKLIVAVPVAVLQCSTKQKSFIELPLFLENYIKAARNIGNGSVIKFLLEFDKAFWLEKDFLTKREIAAPSYIFGDTIIPTWWTQFPSRMPLLTGWVGGPVANKIKNYSDKKFKQLLLESLSSIFSIPPEEIAKRLKKYKIMNWIKEPYILGAYSYSTLQTKKAKEIMRQPHNKTFYFAGEYLAENTSSTVEAALESGTNVANHILEL
ncbi:MAG: NAD(P)/FAD-dependent oxidoreductase, partial [Ginsengibacter sp.]